MSELLPRANSAPIDPRNGAFTSEWYSFFQTLIGGEISEELQAEIDALAERVAQLEADETADFIIQGIGSVSVYGTPQSGVVQVTLYNDVTSPGATYYYGTGPDGVKGWYPVADTVEAATDELTKDVGAEGVTTFGLADTAVTPGTYENATVTVDAKGRVTFAESGVSGAVPYEVADGSFYAVASGYQALFSIPIDLLGASYLDISGALVEVN